MAASPHTGEVLDTVEGVTVVQCVYCGFAHVMPLTTDTELEEFYQKEFYDTEKPDYFKDAEEDKEWWAATYNHYYDLLEAHAAGRRLLDIGSGPGYFLDAGVARGWDVLGFEPSATAAAYAQARGRNVIHEVFSLERAAEHGLFDAIMISLVLEHIPDPTQLIANARQILSPRGVLCVVVPNDYNPLQKILVEEQDYAPWWVVPTHHLNYFTIPSLSRLVAAQGLEQVHLETTYPMEFFLLAGRNYVGNPELGRTCHTERKNLEQALFTGNKTLLQQMYATWATQGIGREIVLIARAKAVV